MPFSPVPNISRVEAVGHVEGSGIGAHLPFIGVDALYWPQISGQQYPPTLSSTTYTDHDGLPVLDLNTTPSRSAIFPAVPRYNGAKRTALVAGSVVITSLVTGGSAAEFISTTGTTLGASTGAGAEFRMIPSPAGTVECRSRNAAGVITTWGSFVIPTGTYTWSIEAAADGTITWTMGANVVTSNPGEYDPTDNALTMLLNNSSTSGLRFYAGPIAVTYS